MLEVDAFLVEEFVRSFPYRTWKQFESLIALEEIPQEVSDWPAVLIF